MKLDFEEFLNDNNLHIGDKIKLSTGEVCEIYQKTKGGIGLMNLDKNRFDYKLMALGIYDFEKIELKKVGEITCDDMDCEKCPLHCINCNVSDMDDTLRELLEKSIEKYPELKPMQAYLEAELNKEVEE